MISVVLPSRLKSSFIRRKRRPPRADAVAELSAQQLLRECRDNSKSCRLRSAE
jgi:hypothetical protein